MLLPPKKYGALLKWDFRKNKVQRSSSKCSRIQALPFRIISLECRRQAVAAGGTTIGTKGMMIATKTMALTAIDLYNTPTAIEESWKEFRKKRGETFKYESLIGDRKPALDYRK